jgi:hypothetical protein
MSWRHKLEVKTTSNWWPQNLCFQAKTVWTILSGKTHSYKTYLVLYTKFSFEELTDSCLGYKLKNQIIMLTKTAEANWGFIVQSRCINSCPRVRGGKFPRNWGGGNPRGMLPGTTQRGRGIRRPPGTKQGGGRTFLCVRGIKLVCLLKGGTWLLGRPLLELGWVSEFQMKYLRYWIFEILKTNLLLPPQIIFSSKR